jgi:hypothetical protein
VTAAHHVEGGRLGEAAAEELAHLPGRLAQRAVPGGSEQLRVARVRAAVLATIGHARD